MVPKALPAAPAAASNNTPPPPPRRRRRSHHRISFVCVNDVYSFDDLDSAAANPRGGWSRASTLMKELGRKSGSRGLAKAPPNGEDDATAEGGSGDCGGETVLTVVNGDVLGGCSLLQYSEGKVAIEVMNSIPIDLAVLGNHEFDYGDGPLMERVKESNFAWLGSNVYYPPCEKKLNSIEYAFQEKVENSKGLRDGSSTRHYFPGIHGNGKIHALSDNLKLGVFGLVTKLTPTISHPSKDVVFDHDILAVARRTAQSLRRQGAQVIVAITHMSEREDLLLAADKESGVDLILGGHEHEPLAKMVHRMEDTTDQQQQQSDHGVIAAAAAAAAAAGGGGMEKHNEGGVLVFKCGMNGYWVGKVDLDISQVQDEATSISTSWSMHSVTSSIKEDRTVSDITKRYRKKTDESAMISCFGEEMASTISLDDVIATIGDATSLPLDTRMSSVRRREATGGNLVADAMHWLMKTNIQSTLPTLAMINGGFIRGDRLYNPGSIFTVREILKELPFPRTMKVLEIEGSHLKEAMAQQLRGSSKGPTGAYPHLSSNAKLTYSIGATSTESDEVAYIDSFKVNGVDIIDNQKYIIAVTCFVADGNEGCSSWLKSTRIQHVAWDDANMSCVLFKYLQCHGVINPVLEDRVKLNK